jgi:hypothetical protein
MASETGIPTELAGDYQVNLEPAYQNLGYLLTLVIVPIAMLLFQIYFIVTKWKSFRTGIKIFHIFGAIFLAFITFGSLQMSTKTNLVWDGGLMVGFNLFILVFFGIVWLLKYKIKSK